MAYVDLKNLKECNCVCLETATKYKDIVHQQDIWHGAKIIGKKVISACISLKHKVVNIQ